MRCRSANFAKFIVVIIDLSSSHISSVNSGVSPHLIICLCPTFVLDVIGLTASCVFISVSSSFVELNVDPVSRQGDNDNFGKTFDSVLGPCALLE